MVLSTVSLALLLVAGKPHGKATPAPTLAGAVARLHDFDDEGARKILLALLASHPTDAIAARCHLYLGHIAMNRVDTETALAEFKTTLRLDVTVEPTMDFSPKGRLVFDRARQEIAAEQRPPPVLVQPLAPAPIVIASAAPSEVPSEVPSKVPSIVTGAVGLAALGTGIVFGVLSNSAVSSARGEPSGAAATQQLSTAKTDAILADVLLPVGGAVGIAAIVLFVLELNGSSDRPASASLGAAPTSTGAVAWVSGSF